MNDKVIKVYKKGGETPLDCIDNLKKERPELGLLPITYAGRLDPLAEGLLLLLIGEECKKKDEYINLSKEYEVEVLFGFETDTYDVMGKVMTEEATSGKLFEKYSVLLTEVFGKLGQTVPNSFPNFASKIQDIIPQFIGKIKQSYPPYSSRPVKGKPLFMWAREGKLDEIEIPAHNVFIENIEIAGNREILGKELLEEIKEKLANVKGDFRQEEIIDIWENELRNKEDEKYPVIKLRISCGSGVYVRVIAQEIGEKLGLPSLALKIVRTKVGEYYI